MTDIRQDKASPGPRVWFGIAALVLVLDQITKIAIIRNFQFGEFLPVTSFFNLVLVYNTGAAFSFLADAGGWQRWFFTLFGIGASLVIIWLLWRGIGTTLFRFALTLILGGAIGNVIDRVLYGHVIDFLDFYIGSLHWPAFNVADMSITVGAILLLVDELLRSRQSR